MAESRWRLHARGIIAAALDALPANATEDDCRRALRGLNPWPRTRTGDGCSWGSQCWSREVKEAMRRRFGHCVQKWHCSRGGVACGVCFCRDWNKCNCFCCHGDPLGIRDALAWNARSLPAFVAGMVQRKEWKALPLLFDLLDEAGVSDPTIREHLENANRTHLRRCGVVRVMGGELVESKKRSPTECTP